MSLGSFPTGQHFFFNDTSSMDTPASTYDIARIVEAAHERAEYLNDLALELENIWTFGGAKQDAIVERVARELRQLASK